MTLLHIDHDFGRAAARPRSRLVTPAWPPVVRQLKGLARAVGRGTGAFFRLAHFAIVAAKLRRLRHERMVHCQVDDISPAPQPDDQRRQPSGAANIPQRPLILDDRWDF